jgi:hypothetical protein
MKRYLLIHLALLVSFFILISLFKGWLNVLFIPFWIGGLIGAFLPDLDYLIHHYFLKTSQTPSVDVLVTDMTSKNIVNNWSEAADNRDNKKLIFHTVHFQLIFVLFAFFVLTSSGSLLGRGIVLAFLLHLFVDEVIDWRYKHSIDSWFAKIPYELDQRQKKWYLVMNGVLLLVFGFLF